MHIYECFLVVTVAPMHLSSICLKFMGNTNPGPMATPSELLFNKIKILQTLNSILI